jgi:hypothetical protein
MAEYIEICSLRNLREAIDLIESAVAKRQGFDPEETVPDDVMYSIREDIQKWADGDNEDHPRYFNWHFMPPVGRCRKIASICLNVDIKVMEYPAPIYMTRIKGGVWWENSSTWGKRIRYALCIIQEPEGDVVDFICNEHSYGREHADMPSTRSECLYRIKRLCCSYKAEQYKETIKMLWRAFYELPWFTHNISAGLMGCHDKYDDESFEYWWEYNRNRAYQLCSAYRLEPFYPCG